MTADAAIATLDTLHQKRHSRAKRHNDSVESRTALGAYRKFTWVSNEGLVFCRADGGFGGKSGKSAEPKTPPEHDPDIVVDLPTTSQSALYYRLNADRNPLHADPAIAVQAGFPAPILHGLCSWSMAAHAVVKACCDYEASRLSHFECRFTKPVFPGETISVDIWHSKNEARFRAWVRERDAMVLDNGFAKFA